MATTSNRSYPYPSDSDSVDVPGDIQALAEAVDNDVDDIVDGVVRLPYVGDVAISTIAADSSGVGSAETTVASISAALVSGGVYEISFIARVSGDVANDNSGLRIKEDNAAGATLFFGNVGIKDTTANGFTAPLWARYTAVSSASKTFVVTLQRTTGTGTGHRIRGTVSSYGYIKIQRVA